VGEFVNNRGRFPDNNQSAGLATATSIKGEYVGAINVGATSGIIIAYYNGNKANTNITSTNLQFSAVRNAGSLEWHCKSTTVKQKWCPSSSVCNG
jgi:type IV pilus assembly protein PilA